jgi:antirestriction protein ArdC
MRLAVESHGQIAIRFQSRIFAWSAVDDRAIFTAASKASQAADYLRSFSEPLAPH